jgi:hypothetical protein
MRQSKYVNIFIIKVKQIPAFSIKKIEEGRILLANSL